MAVTLADVVRALMPDEGDLSQAATALGAEALPHLELLVQSPDAMIAARAAYLAGLIPDARSLAVLQAAAARPEKAVRVAALSVAVRLDNERAANLLERLLLDTDAEIRKLAVETVPPKAAAALRRTLELLALTDPYIHIRELSKKAVQRKDEK